MVERTIDTEAQVQVQINGEPRSIPDGMSVEQLLLHLDLHPKLIVVEHNGEILRRDSYAEARVAAGDTLELVHFVGGG
jgi:thiamine biosynthesis protein ThiS